MKYGYPCPPAMVDSALRYIEVAESVGYQDLIVSLKGDPHVRAWRVVNGHFEEEDLELE